MKTNYKSWRETLASLVDNGLNKPNRIAALLDQFDQRGGNQQAFEWALAQCNASDAAMVEKIKSALEQANQSTVTVNPIARVREYISRFNANLDKVGIEIVSSAPEPAQNLTTLLGEHAEEAAQGGLAGDGFHPQHLSHGGIALQPGHPGKFVRAAQDAADIPKGDVRRIVSIRTGRIVRQHLAQLLAKLLLAQKM